MLLPSQKMSFCIQQNRSVIITAAAIMGTILYLNWIYLIQKQQEISVQQSLIQILRELELKNNVIPSSSVENNNVIVPRKTQIPAAKNKDEFTVAERGMWQGLGATQGHVYDSSLAAALVEFFKMENVTTVLELGAGTGHYAKQMKEDEIFVSCYDGNPDTQELSLGRCGIVDLSKPVDFSDHDWTLSLEVGEHIPQEFEEIFISNLVRNNKYGIVLSWAILGQGGTSHVNTRNNNYIRRKIVEQGYNSDFEVEKYLRDASKYGWFKNTIMVFRKQSKVVESNL